MLIARTVEASRIFRLPEGNRRSDLLLSRLDTLPSKPIRAGMPEHGGAIVIGALCELDPNGNSSPAIIFWHQNARSRRQSRTSEPRGTHSVLSSRTQRSRLDLNVAPVWSAASTHRKSRRTLRSWHMLHARGLPARPDRPTRDCRMPDIRSRPLRVPQFGKLYDGVTSKAPLRQAPSAERFPMLAPGPKVSVTSERVAR
jgi:hypothetical protein